MVGIFVYFHLSPPLQNSNSVTLYLDCLLGELKKKLNQTVSKFCLLIQQVANKILYTGSSDHTARSWVSEFAECTRIYKGHRHTVICMRFYEGLSECQNIFTVFFFFAFYVFLIFIKDLFCFLSTKPIFLYLTGF